MTEAKRRKVILFGSGSLPTLVLSVILLGFSGYHLFFVYPNKFNGDLCDFCMVGWIIFGLPTIVVFIASFIYLLYSSTDFWQDIKARSEGVNIVNKSHRFNEYLLITLLIIQTIMAAFVSMI